MKIVLVNPPQPGLVDPYTYPPVGLAYIRAAVTARRPDDDCRILNLAGHTVTAAKDAVLAQDADVVGYTTTTTYWGETRSLATLVRLARPQVVQAVGGPHPTLAGESAECFDAAFIGPGEASFLRFLRDLGATGHRRVYMPEAWDGVPTPVPEPCDVLGGQLHADVSDSAAVMFTGLGCTGHCAFCAARGMYRKIALREIDDVMVEVEGILAYGITDVRFMDDTFSVDAGRTAALCERLAPTGLRWSCVMRVDQASPPLLAAMKSAGCVEVGFGVESFDQAVLDALNKGTTVQQNTEAVENAHAAGLAVHMFMMISTPGETAAATVDANIVALDGLRDKFRRMLLSTLMPYPGSPIYRNPPRFGALLIEPDATTYNQHQYQGHDADEAAIWSPLLLDGMTRDQQLDNIRQMRHYASTLRQVNRGRFEESTCTP